MRKKIIALIAIFSVASFVLAKDDEKTTKDDKPQSVSEKYRAITSDHLGLIREHSRKYQSAKTEAEKKKIMYHIPDTTPYAQQMLELAKENPKEPITFDALVWILNLGPTGPEKLQSEAVNILISDHLANEKFEAVCSRLAYSFTKPPQLLLAAVKEKSPHKKIRAIATYSLARTYKARAEAVTTYSNLDPDMTTMIKKVLGEEGYRDLVEADPAPRLQRAEELFAEVIEKYSSVKLFRGTIGEMAERDLFEIRHLSIGKLAPDIEGEDIDGVPFHLSDYLGKVVVLDFWGDW